MKELPEDFYLYRGTGGPHLATLYQWFLNADLSQPMTIVAIAREVNLSAAHMPHQIGRLLRLGMISRTQVRNTYLYRVNSQDQWKMLRDKPNYEYTHNENGLLT